MKTEFIKIGLEDKASLKYGGNLLREGKLVAFPTETVYGLGADGLNETAVANIFKAKGRPQDNPLILHVDSIDMVEKLVKEIPEKARKLMDKFWPGPLTIILEKSNLVPDIITGGLDTVAIRMPESRLARDLISYAGRPIAAPSANTSGRPSPTTGEHVYEDLKDKIDLVLDGGKVGIGLESTVVDLSEGVATILRPGAVTLEDLQEVLGQVGEDKSLKDKDAVPKSPGQKYKHYAPKTEMILFVGPNEKMVENIVEYTKKYQLEGKKVGIIGREKNLASYQAEVVHSLGGNLDEIGKNLFYVYRLFDSENVDIILSESVEEIGFGKAIMNRMKKAAGGNIIEG